MTWYYVPINRVCLVTLRHFLLRFAVPCCAVLCCALQSIMGRDFSDEELSELISVYKVTLWCSDLSGVSVTNMNTTLVSLVLFPVRSNLMHVLCTCVCPADMVFVSCHPGRSTASICLHVRNQVQQAYNRTTHTFLGAKAYLG
jgi:hypothetical protein